MTDWLAAFKEIALRVADPSFILGVMLVLTAIAQAFMLMRKSRSKKDDKDEAFDLTDILIGADGRVSRAAVIQVIFAEVVAWSYVLLAIQGKLSDFALVLALSVAISSPAAIRLIDAIATTWGSRPAPTPPPPAPPPSTVTTTTETVVQPPAGA